MVEAGSDRCRHLFIQDGAPFGREVPILIAISVLRAEREPVVAPIAIQLEAMHRVEPPRQHTAKVGKVCITVFVAALLRQMLENPVAVGRTPIQQQRHMVFHDGNLHIRLTRQRTNTRRTGKLLHVCLLGGHLQHTANPAAIFHGNACLEQLHILHRIRIECREQAEQMRWVIHRASIEEDEVLVGSASSHIISAGSLANGGHSRQREHNLHDVRLAKRRRDVLQQLGFELLRTHGRTLHGRLATANNHNLGQLMVVGNTCLCLLRARHHIHLRPRRSFRHRNRIAVENGDAEEVPILIPTPIPSRGEGGLISLRGSDASLRCSFISRKSIQATLPWGDWGFQSSHRCGCGPTKGSNPLYHPHQTLLTLPL